MLPALEKSKTYTQIDCDFTGGLWHRDGAKGNTYFAGENICGDAHPSLLSCPPRRLWLRLANSVHGMICAKDLFLACGGQLFKALSQNKVSVLGNVNKYPKVFGMLGKELLILPDFRVYDTETNVLNSRYINLKLANVLVQNQNYVDEDGIARTIRFNTLHCVDYNFLDYFSPGDSVVLKGSEKNDGPYTIRAVEEYDLRFDENSFVAEDIESCTLTVDAPYPMGGLFACGGRLWGYSEDTIYATVPGDVTNWFRYDGDEQSSFCLKVRGSEPFTACTMHAGRPVFFKSNSMVEVYGDNPTNYSILETSLSGVMEGSGASLCSVGGDMMYLSANGVISCSGSHARVISESLGKQLSDGFAATDGRKYYLCAKDEQGVRALYVYDTVTEAWHTEDGATVTYLGYLNGDVYAACSDNVVYIIGQNKTGHGVVQSPVSSYIEFHPLQDDARGEIVPMRLGVRVYCEQGCHLTLSVSYDGGEWEQRATLACEGPRLWYVPLLPRACHTLGIRIDGDGDYRVLSVIKEYK